MNPKKKNNFSGGEKPQFDFCEVCQLNHNQGRRHNFFPKHKTSLSTLLTRFQSKLSDIRFFLRTPVPLRPEHAERSRLWCVFCSCDILQLGSLYACGNAIGHLASVEHRKKVKSFMWKYGGAMDRIDLFSFSEVEFAKWEKKCKSLQFEAVEEESVGLLKNIHNDLNADYANGFSGNRVNFCNTNSSNSVLPLQSYTNEQLLASGSAFSSIPEPSSSWHSISGDTKLREPKCLESSKGFMSHYPHHSVSQDLSSSGIQNNGYVHSGSRTVGGENASQGSLNLTRICPTSRQAPEGNIHSGALPPWLSAEINPLEVTLKAEHGKKAGKSSRLNPKRVGAAWAERRKLELELESKGEHVPNKFDANWLPNFGGVWQSGTRKESRKEFQSEQKALQKDDDKSEALLPLQPYISKRKRTDTSS